MVQATVGDDRDLQTAEPPHAPSPETVTRRRAWVYVLVATVLVASTPLVRSVSWDGSAELHTLMETAATLLALVVWVMALVRFYSKPTSTLLLIGAGFLGTASLDGYHTIVTSTWFASSFPSIPSSLIPWSWIASRLFLSVLLAFSWFAWKRESRFNVVSPIRQAPVYIGVALFAVTSFIFFAFIPLPRAYYPEFVFGRPEEFVPAAFFLIALIGYLRKGAWKHDSFEHWLVLSILVGVITQASVMSYSTQLFDGMFDAAHLLKKLTYVLVLVGLMTSMYRTFQQVDESASLLARQNELLERSNQDLRLSGRGSL